MAPRSKPTLIIINNSMPIRRRSSADKASAKSQSCDQLTDINSTSKQNSPVKTLYSLPERLSESSDNIDFKESQENSRRCRSFEGILDADDKMHTQLSLPAPLDATTQTKRKKNFMDRCVNKVRLC
ncbi:hypothetical protein KGM_208118 [Danaus plexippus plexippus]|uniref:Uncharacterized protein n=1 Tax=Danaus plexippus plexippus TaxID=278856 RepID=A0A212EQ13_DANPL|nr:hypothetical protein KGM_208118 [Danaus plexippus plexippus]